MHVSSPLALFCWLIIGHCLGDYPLQGDFLANAKNHRKPMRGVPWYQALAAHSIIQAGIVWFITGSWVCALLELVAHWAIDGAKTEITATAWRLDPEKAFDVDQLCHVLCKVFYVFLVAAGLVL